jgi:hypothetical protein
MFTRMIVAAALLIGGGAALASDVAYDQQQIREGNTTLAEGGLPWTQRGDKATRKAAKKTDAPATVAGQCSCQKDHS